MSMPLDITDLEAFQDGDPAQSLEAAVAAVRSYCGWHIAPSVTETAILDTDAGTLLALPTLYLTNVMSIIDAAGNAVDLTEVDWDEAGILRRSLGWQSYLYSNPRVTVTFTHGYDELPADLREVTLSMANSGVLNVGGRIRQVGQVAYDTTGPSSATGYSAAQLGVLTRYRIPRLS